MPPAEVLGWDASKQEKPRVVSHRCCFCSVAKSCLTLCNPTDCSMPSLHVPDILQSLLKFVSIESVMPSNHLLLCRPLLLLPAIFPRAGSFLISRLLAIKEPQTPAPRRAAPSRQQTQRRLTRTSHQWGSQAELRAENGAFPGKYQHTWAPKRLQKASGM